MTRPVATPIAKLIRKSVPKKRVRRSHFSSPGAVPERLHHRQERRQPERQRHEDEVEERRQRELPAGELDRGGGERTHPSGTAVVVEGGADHGTMPHAPVTDSPGSRRIRASPGAERVRRARHRLDGEAPAVHVGQRISGEDIRYG